MDGDRTRDYFYELPKELIAQEGTKKRDESRLMVIHRDSGKIEHRSFKDITEYMEKGDGLVINDSRVIPARLFSKRIGKDEKIEVLLVKPLEKAWRVMARPAKKLKEGVQLEFFSKTAKIFGTVKKVNEDGTREIEFEYEGDFFSIIDEIGEMPIPPYISKKLEDKERYQTVYCKDYGSVAAPTAGLHFTPKLLEEIKQRGIDIIKITLHVGMGTFLPVKTEDIKEHKMHSEFFHISDDASERINSIKKSGGKIFAVGTTSVRTLESSAENGRVKPETKYTDIFIHPGFKFQAADCLITNFHLPESTLLMLVSAFCDRKKILKAYEEAIRERYRFFSFGDAMLIL